ncbi:MAG: DUF5610 domain-containing protein [Methylophaga sp.]
MATPIQPFGETVSRLAKEPANKQDGPFGQQIAALAKAKKFTASDSQSLLNKTILEGALSNSQNRGDKALSLLFKTALQGINDALKPEFGDNAIQYAVDTGVDITPEATAERIVQMSTAFFGAYLNGREDMSQDEALQAFMTIIRGGIDKGFSEARDILSGLQVLEGDIANNIDKTYELVQQGLLGFVDSFSAESKPLE